MRRTVNIVIFRFGVSLLSAVSIACLSANQARSQTSDLSDLPAATANRADTGHSPLAVQNRTYAFQPNSVILSEANNLTDVSLYCGKFSMTDNSCVSAEKPEIQQDETATDLTQLVENGEKSHNQLGSGSPIGTLGGR